MNYSLERKYIQLLKKKIEAALALDNSNGSTKASDLEYVAKVVKEKSGISLSLSTLKRIWKENFAQLPQPTTLNALVTVLDYNNWQEFKQANYIKSRFNTQKIIRISIGLFVIILAAIMLIRFSGHERSSKISAIKINGPVHFTTKKTITKGLPNTVIFNYDVSNVEADSFFNNQILWIILKKTLKQTAFFSSKPGTVISENQSIRKEKPLQRSITNRDTTKHTWWPTTVLLPCSPYIS